MREVHTFGAFGTVL